jgi:hypothetical protein
VIIGKQGILIKHASNVKKLLFPRRQNGELNSLVAWVFDLDGHVTANPAK